MNVIALGSPTGPVLTSMQLAFVDVWVYMNLISNTILLPILVATFLFSKTLKRHPTLINVCVTWIASGIFACLLFYAGKHIGPEPSFELCVAQTSLLAGIAPMWSVAVLMLIYHMCRAFDAKAQNQPTNEMKNFFMLVAPYVTQVAFTIAGATMAVHNPRDVSRDRKILYCSVKSFSLSNAMSIFVLMVGIGITVLLVQLTLTLFRTWKVLTQSGRGTAVEFSVILRVVVFGVYVFFGLCVSAIHLFDGSSVIPDIFAASTGTVVFLIFGTQADVWRVWMWRMPTPQPVLPRSATISSSDWSRRGDTDFKINFDEEEKGSRPSLPTTYYLDEEKMVGLESGRKKLRTPPPALDLRRER